MPNKKISELNFNTTPSGADVFPIVNSGETKQMTLSGLTEFITANSSNVERVDFYTINYNGSTGVLPISAPLSNELAKASAPYLYEAFGHTHEQLNDVPKTFNFYDNFLFEIIEENGIHETGLQFSALTELENYLSLNLSATTADTVANQFTVKMYANRDYSYQKINRVRGINLFLSILRGRHGYWSDAVKIDEGHAKLNNLYNATLSSKYTIPSILPSFVKEIYRHFLNVDSDLYDISNTYGTIWFPGETKRFYNLHALGEITSGIHTTLFGINGGGRTMFNVNTEIFDNVYNEANMMMNTAIFILNEDATAFYHTNGPHFSDGLLDASGNTVDSSIDMKGLPIISNLGSFKDVDENDITLNGVSAIRVYHITNVAGDTAFLVKPIGIDTLLVDYIEDNEDAILYGLFNTNSNGRPMVVKFDESTKSNYKGGNTSWRVNLDEFERYTLDKVSAKTPFIPKKYKKQISRITKDGVRNFRLFYGYPDGSISPFSDDEVFHVVNSNGCNLKRLIRKNPIN